MTEEFGNPQQDTLEVDGIIERHDYAGAEGCADSARGFKSERGVEFVGRNECAGRAPEQDCLKASIAADSAGQVEQVAQGSAHGDLVNARTDHMPGKTKHASAAGILRADVSVGCSALANDLRDVHQRFYIVDSRRLAKETGLRGEGRLVARLT